MCQLHLFHSSFTPAECPLPLQQVHSDSLAWVSPCNCCGSISISNLQAHIAVHSCSASLVLMCLSVGGRWTLYINLGPGRWAQKRATWPKHFRW